MSFVRTMKPRPSRVDRFRVTFVVLVVAVVALSALAAQADPAEPEWELTPHVIEGGATAIADHAPSAEEGVQVVALQAIDLGTDPLVENANDAPSRDVRAYPGGSAVSPHLVARVDPLSPIEDPDSSSVDSATPESVTALDERFTIVAPPAAELSAEISSSAIPVGVGLAGSSARSIDEEPGLVTSNGGGPTVTILGDSDINVCETKSYVVSIQNDSGNPLTDLVIVVRLQNLTGFSYVPGTTSIDFDGGAAFCTADPLVSGGYSGNCAPAPAAPYLTWDIDSLCGAQTLNDGNTLAITFSLQTDCTAVSGSLNTYIDYDINGTPMCDDTGVLNIQVNPGAVTIKKTPNVIPQELGQDVTWTLTVENTGFGTINNVKVTDVLGAGLDYVSSTPAGDNTGQTTTWDSIDIAGLTSMNPGDIITIAVTATVVACENLENDADVRWGCEPESEECFNTATDGGTATASVQRIVKTPLLDLAPPNVTFTYCSDEQDVSFTITNIGDGTAHDVWLLVDFGGLTVSNVSAGAIYSAGENRFELAVPLAPSPGPGNTYELSFRLNHSTWCGGGFPSGDLLWQVLYKDDCDQEFYPPVELSTVNPPAFSTSLSVGKTGAPSAIQIGDLVTYSVSSSYSGPLSCGSGDTTDVTVVDAIPDGFTVIDAGGGVWVPGGGGTGGSITWTYTPPASLNTVVTFQSPLATQCETYCFTSFTNSIGATATDCCGCVLSASDSQTTVIECEELVDSEKTAVPTTGIRCDSIQYTNTYVFADNAALDTVDLSQLVFQEDADNEQEYDPGSLAVTLSGSGDITACALSGLTDTTPGAGGNLIIDFSNCSTYGSVRNKTLTIVYRLTITENTVGACAGASFHSWSSLDLNLVTGGECLSDGIIHETTLVSVEPPAMSLALTGLGEIIHKCETQTISMDLTQASTTADPKDVRLVLSGLNYYVVDPSSVTGIGVVPTSADYIPTVVGDGDQYIWGFGDGFTGSGQSATITLDVQKRCSGGGDLVATAYYDDNCNDDAIYDDTCSTVATETPALLLSGDLLIEKNPEVYYASANTVQWKIYLTNRGSGTAYNVWIDDELGAGLDYVSAVVDNMTGVTITADQDHDGSPINGCTIAISQMSAGERREITFNALLIDCDNLTNDASASWGCVGVDCQTLVTDNSTVKIPAPLLINTNTITPAGGVDACSSTDGFITLRNAGQVTCYNLQVTENLPAGLNYIPGSTRWQINGGGWNGPNAAYDPVVSGSPEQLDWTLTEIDGLDQSDPGDTIEIEFGMAADCPFTGGNIICSTQYENPCADVFNTASSVFTVALREPDISITKTRTSPPPGEPIACGQQVVWQILVENTGTLDVPVVWVEDTMDPGYTFVSSTGGNDGGLNGYGGNPLVTTWEILYLNVGQSTILTLTADSLTSLSADCEDIGNVVEAFPGCGVVDGSSATKPGVDAPDDTLCLASIGVSDTDTPTREPTLGFLSIGVNPITLDSCNDNTQLTVTIQNTGPTDAENVDLVITLPTGITYNSGSSTVTCGGVTGPALDPTESGNQLIYYDITDNAAGKADNLCDTVEAAGGNDTLVLVLSVRSDCYVTADMGFDLYYYDCCEDTQYSTTDSETITALYPDLAITKTPTDSQVDCGGQQSWTITVINNGTGNAQVVRIEDTPGAWIDARTGQPGDPIDMGGGVYGWEINNLAGSGGSQVLTLVGTLNPDGLPNQNDCADALRQNNVSAVWGCGTAGDAIDNDPTTTAYDCEDTSAANAPVATLQLPNLVVTSITPDVSCISDGNFDGSISVRVTNNGDGATSGTFTVEVTDGKGWTGTGTYGLAIASGSFADVTINTGTWAPDCQPCGAPYSFNATVDLNDDICECNETDNTTGSPTTYTVPVPDLAVDADTLSLVCTDDGQVTVTGSVTLINNGCNTAITSNIPMRFTLYDNTGCAGSVVEQWTETFSSVNIAAGGGTQAFLIPNHAFTSNMCADSTGCQVSIFVEADYSDTVCECDGTNNTYCADNKSISIPDLEATSDTLTVTCLDDGQVTVSGNVTLVNNGCGSNLNSNIPMRFTLYDNTGCAGSVVDQWTQMFAGVNIAAGGGTQVFTITPRTVTSDLVANSTGCQVSIRVEADYNDSVCECDGTDNTYCADNKSIDIPNLQVTGDTLGTTCLGDGQFTVAGTVTMVNNGCGSNLNSNIPVRFTIYDNTGCAGSQVAQWTETLAGVNIPALGGTQVFAITPQNITSDLAANSTGCQFSIRVEADYNDTICESIGTDNAWCSNQSAAIPDLRVNSVTPSVNCAADGTVSGIVTVNVGNIGCSDVVGAVVQLTSSCGSVTFVDQTVNLTAGSNSDLTFNYTPTPSTCTCDFTAAIDPGNLICESNNTNNAVTFRNYTPDVPDLTVQSDTLQVSCSSDGNVTISGNLVVANNGCGTTTSDIPVRFTLYDNTGCTGNVVSTWTETLTGININGGGGTQAIAISAQTVTTDLVSNSTGCQFSIRVEADYNDSVCEFDGTDNTYCADSRNVDLPDIEVSSDTMGVACTSDGQVSISGNVTLANNGCGSNMTTDVSVHFTLYDNTGCSGNMLSQWTETFSSVNIPAGGGTQVFPINPYDMVSDICATSTDCQVSIRIEADYTEAICESDGADNTLCSNKSIAIPDLSVDAVTYSGPQSGLGTYVGWVTVDVSNVGCAAANGVVVQLISDCGLTFPDQTIDLAAGASDSLAFGVTPLPLSPSRCIFTATVDSQDSICECGQANNVGSSQQAVMSSELILSKAPDGDRIVVGGHITYTINVTNTGDANATDALISDTLPSALAFIGPIGLEGTTGTVTQNAAGLPTLASGLTITAGTRITITLPVRVTGLGLITNTVSVSDTQLVSPTVASARITGDPVPPATMTGCPESFCPGWTLGYSIGLTNTLPVPMTNLVITDVLPIEVCCPTDAPWSMLHGVVNAPGNQVSWHVATLLPGQSILLGLEVHSLSGLSTGTVITNTVYYMADQLLHAGEGSIILTADRDVCAQPQPTPTPTPTATCTLTPSATPTATPTPTPTPAGRFLLPIVMKGG